MRTFPCRLIASCLLWAAAQAHAATIKNPTIAAPTSRQFSPAPSWNAAPALPPRAVLPASVPLAAQGISSARGPIGASAAGQARHIAQAVTQIVSPLGDLGRAPHGQAHDAGSRVQDALMGDRSRRPGEGPAVMAPAPGPQPPSRVSFAKPAGRDSIGDAAAAYFGGSAAPELPSPVARARKPSLPVLVATALGLFVLYLMGPSLLGAGLLGQGILATAAALGVPVALAIVGRLRSRRPAPTPVAITVGNLPGRYVLKADVPDSRGFIVEMEIGSDGTYASNSGFQGVLDPQHALSGTWSMDNGRFVGVNPTPYGTQRTEIDFLGATRDHLSRPGGASISMASSQAGAQAVYPFRMMEVPAPPTASAK